jgi:putative transposase
MVRRRWVDRAQEIGLFRWRVVGEAADVSLSARERGRLVRAFAQREYLGPDGRWVRVSRNTLDRWIRSYRECGVSEFVIERPQFSTQRLGCW